MIRRICKWVVFKCIYPVCYFIGSCRKVDSGKIIFVENHGEDISDNYILLYEMLERRGYQLRTHYLQMSSSSWPVIVGKSLRLIWDMSTAHCVFLNDSNSIFGAFTLRQDTKLVQLWHACGAFKKWGYSVVDKTFGEDAQTFRKYSGHKNYNLVTVSGESVCWAYEEAFGLQDKPDVVKALGVSRTDVYFSEERKQQAYEALQAYDSFIKGRKILLYSPTFRGEIQNAKSPDYMNLQVLTKLQNQYVCIIKQHPFVKERYPIPDAYKGFCIEADNQISIEELLIVSDVCVTDYSSIIFEYSLLKKPILFFAKDLEEYYDERGFYYPYEEFVPGPVVKTTEELVQNIEQIVSYDKDKIYRFANQYMSGCDGHSTERIIEYVLQ